MKESQVCYEEEAEDDIKQSLESKNSESMESFLEHSENLDEDDD